MGKGWAGKKNDDDKRRSTKRKTRIYIFFPFLVSCFSYYNVSPRRFGETHQTCAEEEVTFICYPLFNLLWEFDVVIFPSQNENFISCFCFCMLKKRHVDVFTGVTFFSCFYYKINTCNYDRRRSMKLSDKINKAFETFDI